MWGCTGTPSLYAATCMGSIRQASASATGDASAGDGERANGSLQRTAGSGEQQTALGPLLKKFPPPGAEYVPPSEVPAMRWAYDTKFANALSGLSGVEGAFGTIETKMALAQYWTVQTTRERSGQPCIVEQADCKSQFFKRQWQAACGAGLDMHWGMH